MLNFKRMVHIRAICTHTVCMRMLPEHVYETCKYARKFNKLCANLRANSKHSSYMLHVLNFLYFLAK